MHKDYEGHKVRIRVKDKHGAEKNTLSHLPVSQTMEVKMYEKKIRVVLVIIGNWAITSADGPDDVCFTACLLTAGYVCPTLALCRVMSMLRSSSVVFR